MSEQTTGASISLIDRHRHVRKREMHRDRRSVSPTARSDVSRQSSISSVARLRSASRDEKLRVSDYPRPLTCSMNASMRGTPLSQSTNHSTNNSSTTFDQLYARRSGVSSRYDFSIVYALDEVLTRGAYAVFAKWFFSYINENDLPGCIVVIGLRNGCGIGGYGQPSTTHHIATTTTTFIASSERSNDSDEKQQADAKHRRRDGEQSYGLTSDETFSFGGVSDHPVPYVPLDPNDDCPIFALKRQTGYPTIILLVTLRGSRLEYLLSCDGSIIIHPRETMRIACSRVAEVLVHITDTYLFDLYYDDVRDRQIRRLGRDPGNIGIKKRDIANVGRRESHDDDDDDDEGTLLVDADDDDNTAVEGSSVMSSLATQASSKRTPCNILANEEQKCEKICDTTDKRDPLLLEKYLLDGKTDYMMQDPRATTAIEVSADIDGIERTANFVVRNENINDNVARNWRVLQQLRLAQGSIVRDPNTIRIVNGNGNGSPSTS